MPKLLRNRKKFGRCQVEGHGQDLFCEVMEDIQTNPFTRAQDKRECKEEIEGGIAEYEQNQVEEYIEDILD